VAREEHGGMQEVLVSTDGGEEDQGKAGKGT